jgi:hypothetical protein
VKTGSALRAPRAKRKTMPDTVRLEQAAAKAPLGTIARSNHASAPGSALRKTARSALAEPERGGPRCPSPHLSGTARSHADTSANEKRGLTKSDRFESREGSAGNLQRFSPGRRQKTVDSSRVTEKLQMLGRLEGR